MTIDGIEALSAHMSQFWMAIPLVECIAQARGDHVHVARVSAIVLFVQGEDNREWAK